MQAANEDPYAPIPSKILSVRDETSDIKTFELEQKIPTHKSGQFVQLTVYGVGEAPISISSSPDKLLLTVKKLGRVTGALFEKKPGDLVGIRGPYGNGWPMKEMKGKSVLIVAGGVGLPPLRGVVYEILRNRSSYAQAHLCYGARTPGDLVFCDEMKEWAKGINTHQTVDVCGAAWMGDVGFVAKLVEKYIKKDDDLVALMCGPSLMMTTASKALTDKGCRKSQIYVSLERLMHCGIGKCGHCMAGGKCVCQDGPVFRLDQIEGLSENLM